jgi:glutamate--cysteine ligase
VTDAWAHRIGTAFAARFPPRDPTRRRLGREGEHPVVHADGTAADIAVLWPRLIAGGGRVLKEGDLVVGLEDEGVTFSAEVGRGTIEIIVGPSDDLHDLRARYEAGMERLLAATDAEGLLVLGYGIQPATAPSFELMSAKQRYRVLWEQLGDVWLSFAVTASDQVHVDVAPAEIVAVTNLANLLAPLSIALCANSPVVGGAPSGACSGREAAMGVLQAEGHRHGMTEGPVADLDGWVGRTLDLPYLMHRDGALNVPYTGTFRQWLDAAPRTDGEALADWLWHEHYIWNSARPRSAHGTVELRSPCQQPWGEHMAAAALGAGVVEAHVEIARFLDDRLGDPWPAMRAWHRRAVASGLAADEPAPGLIAGVLERARDGLVRRGKGEETLLDPLFGRLERRRNPAQDALAAFERGGVAALVQLVRVR